MNRKFTLLSTGLLLATMSLKAQFQSVALTGFNADIIANGVGPATGSITPGTNADNGSYAFVSKDFKAVSTNAVPTYGLPVTGSFTSAYTAGLPYQLADYSSNNALRLVTTAPSGTLTLTAPTPASTLYVLAYSGNGPANTDYTINFSDGTTQTGTLSITDWYSTATTSNNYAIQGIGRVSVSGDNALQGSSTTPRLFEFSIATTAANNGKQITSVAFNKTSTGTSIVGVMGLSVFLDTNVYAPITLSGFNADVVANGTGAPATTTDNDVDGGTPAYVFLTADYKALATCAAPTRSLPQNGTITSMNVTNANLVFQLASYSGPNDLRLTGTGSGTLTFGTPTAAKTVYLLAVGGNGAARISAVVNFSDGTSQTFSSLDISDWYNTGTVAIQGISRVQRNTTACGGMETSTTSPKLFQVPMTIDAANTSKLINSVAITRINGVTNFAGIPNIMAISVGNTNPSLPITLNAFTGYRNAEGNKLEWTTATEQNNSGFEVERSTDSRTFSKIAFVASKATNGNSTAAITYSVTDKNNLVASAYYRLKQIDKDGKATYSRTVFIKGLDNKNFNVTALYPNPVKGQLQVQITAAKEEKLTLIVADAAGKIVLQKAVQVKDGANNINLNVQQINTGNYFIKAIGANGASGVSKFVKY